MFTADRPIFVQLAEQLADDIASGGYPEETAVPSTNELAAFHRINPATAGRALNLLVERGVLYKRRGIGMFVATGAVDALRQEARAHFDDQHVRPLLREAHQLGMTLDEVHRAIDRAWPETNTDKERS